MQLPGKVVVVTGGGNGIGRQTVLTLLAKHATVAAIDINFDALLETQKLAEPWKHKLSLHKADISNRESVALLTTEIIKQHNCVDAIINNAGIVHPFDPVSALDFNVIERVININLYGVINMTKAFLPLLMERPQAHITNVSSMGGLFAFPTQTIYGASKAAVKLFSEGLYAELRGSKISVSVIYPGAISTNITLNSGAHTHKLDRFKRFHEKGTSPETVARRIVNAMEKEQFSVHVGLDSKILSFLYRMFPVSTILILSKLMKLAMK